MLSTLANTLGLTIEELIGAEDSAAAGTAQRTTPKARQRIDVPVLDFVLALACG